MGLRQTYQKMITSLKGGWEGMAGNLGLSSVAALENYVYEKKGQCMSVQMALLIQDFSGTTLFAKEIAELSGGTFVKLPSVDHIDNESLLAKFNELYAELGQLSQTYAAATADGEIDKREKAELTAISDEIHRTMQELMGLMFRIYCRKEVTA